MRRSHKSFDIYHLREDIIKKQIDDILDELTIAERDIISLYYGIGEYDYPLTLDNIAKIYCCSKQAVSKKICNIYNKIKLQFNL
jgi:DNA-directed RNA polymerase sigma subunit (sigma70/sigma32)